MVIGEVKDIKYVRVTQLPVISDSKTIYLVKPALGVPMTAYIGDGRGGYDKLSSNNFDSSILNGYIQGEGVALIVMSAEPPANPKPGTWWLDIS
jgi:hypothetical protein